VLLAGEPGRGAVSVYFMRAGSDGLVKIGCATDVEKRRAELQTGCPATLEVIATIPGGRDREKALHAHWKHRRVRGEWFKITEADISAKLLDERHEFDLLVAVEPGLADLEAVARNAHGKCANAVWYGRIKPRLLSLVGWERGVDLQPTAYPGIGPWRSVSLSEIGEGIQTFESKGPAVLRTMRAYDVAYDFLYSLLPDCDHEGWC